MQLLVFDAKVTNASYGTWEFENRQAEKLINMYNATLRFVATMSGLTRWQFIFGETEVEGDKCVSFNFFSSLFVYIYIYIAKCGI